MQALYLVVLLAGLGYFSFAKRHVDTFTVAFFGAVLYFLPGAVGYTLSPVTPDRPIKMPVRLESEALAIMAFVLFSILISGIIWDRVSERIAAPRISLRASADTSMVGLMLGVLGLIAAIAETSGQIFSPDKREVIGVVSRGHLLFEMSASISAIFAVLQRRRVVFAASSALLVLDMWFGFRNAFSMTFLAILLIYAHRLGRVRLVSMPRRYLIAALFGGLLIISYQNLKEPIRNGNWAEVSRRVTSPVWYLSGVMTSEPFTTQTVLNEVVRRDFRTSTDHLWSATHHLIFFSPALGAESVRFNDLYQPELFPTVDHGLATNIWAQFWSATGWPGLCVFVVVFVAMTGAGSYLMRARDDSMLVVVALSFVYWCFYIHRNELLVQIGYQKLIVVLWVAIVGLTEILDRARLASRMALKGGGGSGGSR